MAEPPFTPPYPGYDVLDKWDSPSWNDTTREVVRRRLDDVPPRRFFSEEHWAVLEAVCARLVPQPDRTRPIPIAPWIDARLHADHGSGTQLESLPWPRPLWRRALTGIDREARLRKGKGFLELDDDAKDAVLRCIQAGDTRSAVWKGMPAPAVFKHILGEVVAVYYSHPAAWSETGYGGPASPRGYARLETGRTDPWDAR